MKTKVLMVAAMMGLLATACNKENEEQEIISTPVTITANYEGSNTKVTYTEDGNTITAKWQEGDEIKVVVDGQVSTLTLQSGAGSTSATFSGEISHTNPLTATTLLICYVSDANYSGEITVNANGSYTYTSGAFTCQNGTLADAAKRNLYYGVAQYGDGSNINCTFGVNTSMMKFTVATGLAENTPVTLSYKSNGTTIASSSFALGANGTKTVYMSIPAGKYDGTQTLVCNDGSSDATATLSSTRANFAAGQTYSKSFVYLFSSTGEVTATNGAIIAGTGGSNTRLEIAAGATVTLSDVTISSISSSNNWSGITCLGNATINLKGRNTVKGGGTHSGIYPAHNTGEGDEYTLTIQGTGSLYARYGTNGNGAGIGCGYNDSQCGNIEIKSGTITAEGVSGATGIGTSGRNVCGNITISGGTVEAKVDYYGSGAGIGASTYGTCGDITISGGTVIARASATQSASIGCSSGESACGTITITSGITRVEAQRTSGNDHFVGEGEGGYQPNTCTDVVIDGKSKNSGQFTFTTSTEQFDHLNSTVSADGKTWTLTKKN